MSYLNGDSETTFVTEFVNRCFEIREHVTQCPYTSISSQITLGSLGILQLTYDINVCFCPGCLYVCLHMFVCMSRQINKLLLLLVIKQTPSDGQWVNCGPLCSFFTTPWPCGKKVLHHTVKIKLPTVHTLFFSLMANLLREGFSLFVNTSKIEPNCLYKVKEKSCSYFLQQDISLYSLMIKP